MLFVFEFFFFDISFEDKKNKAGSKNIQNSREGNVESYTISSKTSHFLHPNMARKKEKVLKTFNK